MTPIIQLSSPTETHSNISIPVRGEADIRTDAVYVVYTSPEETLAALRVADNFARALSVPITLVHYRAVPYPLPVDAPAGISPIETEGFLERVRASHLDVRIQVHLCRDERCAIAHGFNRPSLVVVGGQRRWWPTRAARCRARLEAAGHLVVFVDSSEASRAFEAAASLSRVAHKETSHA